MRTLLLLVVVLASISGCARPPDDAYIGNGTGHQATVALGKDASGEACNQIETGQSRSADIFCGAWRHPAAHVRAAPSADGSRLTTVAMQSSWRQAINARFVCGAPKRTRILSDGPALVLQCRRRVGGWPQVALVASVGGRIWAADGILPTLPVMERSIGVLAGRVSPSTATTLPPSAADVLLTNVLVAHAFSAGDIGRFEELMSLGARANLAENFASAEQAYRAALVLQQKALGADNPDTVGPLMHLALQVSDQGRYAQADALFHRAATLVARASDPTAPARLLHYEALDALNQGHDHHALGLLRRAQAAYAALVPPQALAAAVDRSGLQKLLPTGALIDDPTTESALIGLVETKRYTAIVLRQLGEHRKSEAEIANAQSVAAANGLAVPLLSARLIRTAAVTDGVLGRSSAAEAALGRSSSDFMQILPETKPVAETALLQAGEFVRQHQDGRAIRLCHAATALLRKLRTGTHPALLAPCLMAYAAEAHREPTQAQTLLAAMFATAELAQDTVTARQIAEAAARLAANTHDPRVAAAIRRRQDEQQRLATLYRERDILLHGATPGTLPPPAVAPGELDRRIAAAQASLSDADAALQAAAPNYGQLIEDVVPASSVLKALKPGEAFVAITLTDHTGWVFALRDGRISAAQLHVGTDAVGKLVRDLRASIEPTVKGLPVFDVAAAYDLYKAVLAPVAPELRGAKDLVVAPSGPLLSIPFAVLLTGPTTPAHLSQAPWLIRQMTIAHVPSAANFVALRRIAGTSRAREPWFGFGDFHPVTLAQAEHSFPSAACADSARLFAGLPPLPFAIRELTAARLLLGGRPTDELLGSAFTVPAVEQADLKDYRVLHFATHALLPTDLRCEPQPAIVTSAPPGATSASNALLTASDVMELHLDADLVILSACNTGGPGGADGGDSLSGLARAFFYAGARALLVTHWSISDQSSAYLIAETLGHWVSGKYGGLAGSLRAAQLGMLTAAGKTLPTQLADPFFWAPFALIGDGSGQEPMPRVATGA